MYVTWSWTVVVLSDFVSLSELYTAQAASESRAMRNLQGMQWQRAMLLLANLDISAVHLIYWLQLCS